MIPSISVNLSSARPTDLSAIKKSIENGSTRTNTEFHRDVALMFLNSVFYNPCDNEVHRLAKEMLDESNSIIQVDNRFDLIGDLISLT